MRTSLVRSARKVQTIEFQTKPKARRLLSGYERLPSSDFGSGVSSPAGEGLVSGSCGGLDLGPNPGEVTVCSRGIPSASRSSGVPQRWFGFLKVCIDFLLLNLF